MVALGLQARTFSGEGWPPLIHPISAVKFALFTSSEKQASRSASVGFAKQTRTLSYLPPAIVGATQFMKASCELDVVLQFAMLVASGRGGMSVGRSRSALVLLRFSDLSVASNRARPSIVSGIMGHLDPSAHLRAC
jgi:hypothetical protein